MHHLFAQLVETCTNLAIEKQAFFPTSRHPNYMQHAYFLTYCTLSHRAKGTEKGGKKGNYRQPC